MPRDEEYSRQKLERFLPVFYDAAVNGVRAVMDGYSDSSHIHRKTTRRSLVRDHIVDNLRSDLLFDPDVSVKDRNQTTYFEIGSEFCLLAKMANADGDVALNRNQAAFDFQENGQSTLFQDDELPGQTNLYLSYVHNPFEPREPFVYVICPKKGGYHWRMEIEPPALEASAEIVHTPDNDGDTDLIRIPDAKPDISEK